MSIVQKSWEQVRRWWRETNAMIDDHAEQQEQQAAADAADPLAPGDFQVIQTPQIELLLC